MLQLNQPSNLSPVSLYLIGLPTPKMVLVSMWQQLAFGTVVVKVHSLMLECLTLLHKPMSVKPLAACYRKHEHEKRRIYEQRVRDVEHGCFSPLVFNTSGGMGPISTTVYKRIASLISEKYDRPYSNTIRWIRCRLNFSLLRSTIMCLRGSQSSPVTVLYLLTQTLTLPFMRAGSLFKYSYTFTVLLVISC